MEIFGKKLTRHDTKRYAGNLDQLGGARPYELTEGRAKGTKAIDVNTGTGLTYTIIPDCGFDISQASYKGINLVWRTQNAEVHPSYYNSQGLQYDRNFFAGLLTTYGMINLGGPEIVDDEEYPLMGRFNTIPARSICDLSYWEQDEYLIKLSGIVEEFTLFRKDKLRTQRSIESQIGKKYLRIQDKIENFGLIESPLNYLYGINFGFPLLDSGCRLVLTTQCIKPLTQWAEKEIKDYASFIAPNAADSAPHVDQNFLHTMIGDEDGFGYAALINPQLLGGLGVYIKFKIDTIPLIVEWKKCGEGDYVVGLEIGNVPPENLSTLKKMNILKTIKPREVVETSIEIGILEGAGEIARFEKMVAAVCAKS